MSFHVGGVATSALESLVSALLSARPRLLKRVCVGFRFLFLRLRPSPQFFRGYNEIPQKLLIGFKPLEVPKIVPHTISE